LLRVETEQLQKDKKVFRGAFNVLLYSFNGFKISECIMSFEQFFLLITPIEAADAMY